jgi:hypothetical protein
MRIFTAWVLGAGCWVSKAICTLSHAANLLDTTVLHPRFYHYEVL